MKVPTTGGSRMRGPAFKVYVAKLISTAMLTVKFLRQQKGGKFKLPQQDDISDVLLPDIWPRQCNRTAWRVTVHHPGWCDGGCPKHGGHMSQCALMSLRMNDNGMWSQECWPFGCWLKGQSYHVSRTVSMVFFWSHGKRSFHFHVLSLLIHNYKTVEDAVGLVL